MESRNNLNTADVDDVVIGCSTQGGYQASYAGARGDILLAQGRSDEARQAYTQAMSLAGANPGQVNLVTLQQKLQSLNPVPARGLLPAAAADVSPDPDPVGQVAEEQ